MERARALLQRRIDAAGGRSPAGGLSTYAGRSCWRLAALLVGAFGFGLGAWRTPSGVAGTNFVGVGFVPAKGWTSRPVGNVSRDRRAEGDRRQRPARPRRRSSRRARRDARIASAARRADHHDLRHPRRSRRGRPVPHPQAAAPDRRRRAAAAGSRSTAALARLARTGSAPASGATTWMRGSTSVRHAPSPAQRRGRPEPAQPPRRRVRARHASSPARPSSAAAPR